MLHGPFSFWMASHIYIWICPNHSCFVLSPSPNCSSFKTIFSHWFKRQKHSLFFYPFPHSLVDSCVCLDQGLTPQPWCIGVILQSGPSCSSLYLNTLLFPLIVSLWFPHSNVSEMWMRVLIPQLPLLCTFIQSNDRYLLRKCLFPSTLREERVCQ